MIEYCVETYHDDAGWVRRRKFYDLEELRGSDYLKSIALSYPRWRIVELVVRVVESHKAATDG